METISYLIITLVFWGISFLFIFIFFIIFFYGSLGPFSVDTKKPSNVPGKCFQKCIQSFKNSARLSVLPVGPPQCRVSRGCSPLPYNYYYYATMLCILWPCIAPTSLAMLAPLHTPTPV